MDVGAYGHDLAVDILERELAGTQAAVGAKRDNLVERDLGREPKRAGSALGKCLHARRVVHGQARADLRRGSNLGGQGELRDVANSDRGTGNNPGVNTDVVNDAADLVEYGYDTLPK